MPPGLAAQDAGTPPGLSARDYVSLLPPMEWRSIGPDRGGRSIAVAGHAERPLEYYFGATGGGLFKTTDGGNTWRPVTDGQIGSASVGAVAMAPSDPDIVYIGMGEVQLRANVLQGDGVYRSDDAGKRWRHLGLADTHAIGRIRIHPTDPDRAYVAALGHPFGPNDERGVFRTTDGGKTWEKVLFRDEHTGAVDLVMDPSNPDVLYATLWQVYRKPWRLWSGGEGSGIFKSADGGDTWREITRNPGLPTGVLGKITVTVSGADSNRVWANIEAERGGLYRSDDGGLSWELINDHRDIWQRAFYFQRLEADPVDRNTLYILNFRLMRSTDGGQTLESVPETHADHHDLWIDPANPLRMINGNDGGGVVTVNGGRTWTSMRYPTAQIYRLTTTSDFPYHVCGAQQDNTTVCVSSEPGHLRDPRSPSTEWMYAVGGGEMGYIAQHPANPDIFYAGATNTLTRYDRATGLVTDIQPWPRIVMGEPARDMPERWNWTYPIAVAPTPPHALYVGSQHLWRSADEGASWARISPDLTRAEPETLDDSGGPIVLDQDGPEIYGTLYSIGLSPHDPETIWTGSDDGLVHMTRDGGGEWHDVTPADMPPHTRVMTVEVSPHDPARAHVAGIRYEMDDRSPYVWKTDDYGATWTRISDGIPAGAFVRVIREDPKRGGLLYAGTEHGCVRLVRRRRELGRPVVGASGYARHRDLGRGTRPGHQHPRPLLLGPRRHRDAAAARRGPRPCGPHQPSHPPLPARRRGSAIRTRSDRLPVACKPERLGCRDRTGEARAARSPDGRRGACDHRPGRARGRWHPPRPLEPPLPGGGDVRGYRARRRQPRDRAVGASGALPGAAYRRRRDPGSDLCRPPRPEAR